ncbi:hypothetical protein KFE25_004300 [Diacronema lutheri]|uniref:Uncharacterized protein n=1 Tax=Diacronema lutheri TaxID=2081491 RepID=A0A8J5X293_DIALT|nr:hypothetical protein KFE25_004300 [Diacronema lutheri]
MWLRSLAAGRAPLGARAAARAGAARRGVAGRAAPQPAPGMPTLRTAQSRAAAALLPLTRTDAFTINCELTGAESAEHVLGVLRASELTTPRTRHPATCALARAAEEEGGGGGGAAAGWRSSALSHRQPSCTAPEGADGVDAAALRMLARGAAAARADGGAHLARIGRLRAQRARRALPAAADARGAAADGCAPRARVRKPPVKALTRRARLVELAWVFKAAAHPGARALLERALHERSARPHQHLEPHQLAADGRLNDGGAAV